MHLARFGRWLVSSQIQRRGFGLSHQKILKNHNLISTRGKKDCICKRYESKLKRQFQQHIVSTDEYPPAKISNIKSISILFLDDFSFCNHRNSSIHYTLIYFFYLIKYSIWTWILYFQIIINTFLLVINIIVNG